MIMDQSRPWLPALSKVPGGAPLLTTCRILESNATRDPGLLCLGHLRYGAFTLGLEGSSRPDADGYCVPGGARTQW